MVVVETERLSIRRFHPEDERPYLDLYADEVVMEFINKRSIEENQKRFAEGMALSQDGTGLGRWAIFNRVDNDFIGVCALNPSDKGRRYAEMGYILHQKYWGKGIAGEMARALVDYAFTRTGIIEIMAVTAPLNIASQRVLEKAGFTRGNDMVRDGHELAFFRILKTV